MAFCKEIFEHHMACPYCQSKSLTFFKKLFLPPQKGTRCISCDKSIRISNISIIRNAILMYMSIFHPGYPEYLGVFTLVSIVIVFLFVSELFIKLKPYREQL